MNHKKCDLTALDPKIFITIFVILALIFPNFPIAFGDLSDFNYRIQFTIDDALIDLPLTNVPVLVYLDNSRIDWSLVQDDLDDIRFLDAGLTEYLDYEIDHFNLNSEAWFWVEIPSISSVADTIFYMYYNNVDATSGENPSGVWHTDYIFVDHLNDLNTTATYDSTGNGNDGLKLGVGEPLEDSSGIIGNAQNFDGSDDYLDLGAFDFSGKTLSYWAISDDGTVDQGIFSDETIGSWDSFISMRSVDDAGEYFAYENDTGTAKYSQHSLTSAEVETWTHYSFLYNGTDIYLYINGSIVDSDNVDSFGSVTVRYLAQGFRNDAGWNGRIDELRLYDGTTSLEFINTEFLSGSDSLLTYGDPQYLQATPSPDETEVTFDFEEWLFGEMALFGILVFIILGLVAIKLSKYSGVFVGIIGILYEVMLYDNLDIYGNNIWYMIIVLFYSIFAFIAVFYDMEK